MSIEGNIVLKSNLIPWEMAKVKSVSVIDPVQSIDRWLLNGDFDFFL